MCECPAELKKSRKERMHAHWANGHPLPEKKYFQNEKQWWARQRVMGVPLTPLTSRVWLELASFSIPSSTLAHISRSFGKEAFCTTKFLDIAQLPPWIEHGITFRLYDEACWHQRILRVYLINNEQLAVMGKSIIQKYCGLAGELMHNCNCHESIIFVKLNRYWVSVP